jgi:DNA repair protein RAD7
LEEFYFADDSLLELIRDKCQHMKKLRLAINAEFTDKALANLFRGWSNPPLSFADFHRVRDVDMANPAGPPEPVGLASDGFVALMEHSGARLESLNVASCRHISYAAYEEAFGEHKRYPELKYLDISFNGMVDDYLAQCIFRCCPALTRLVVFGCFKIRDINIPRGVAVIGTVGAKLTIDGITQKELV